MLRTLEEKVDPKHAALIIVDMQNDFCHDNGVSAKDGLDVSFIQKMTPNLINLLSEAHKHNLPVIFIGSVNNDWSQSEVWLEKRKRTNSTQSCWEGTWGSEFYEVAPQVDDYIVTKYRYSAFTNTTLDLILRNRGIKTLIMSGVATNVCVETTAREGLMRDYYIVFLSDCTAAFRREDHEAALRNMENFFGVVTTSSEVIKAWAKIKENVTLSNVIAMSE